MILISMMNMTMITNRYFTDKPEVSAEESVVHAGVGHQAILVCQVTLRDVIDKDKNTQTKTNTKTAMQGLAIKPSLCAR